MTFPSVSKPLDLIIVEDQKEVREGLRYLLGLDPRVNVVRTFERVETFLEALDTLPTPDLVLMDIGLPGMSGIEGVRILKKRFPAVIVIILTVFEDTDRILESIRAGANGYLLKSTKPDILLEQILGAVSEGSPLSPRVAKRILEEIQDSGEPSELSDYGLTPRERQILTDVVNGFTYREIAARYSIAASTVKKHILHIYQKLDVNSRAEFVKKAIREKLV
ncbi:MAG: response regulator transcription factor [Spirochaetes bacterium]|nr:response regulator transcription factor [Spirochaetota bacterium]